MFSLLFPWSEFVPISYSVTRIGRHLIYKHLMDEMFSACTLGHSKQSTFIGGPSELALKEDSDVSVI
jgi:hypothetical protein